MNPNKRRRRRKYVAKRKAIRAAKEAELAAQLAELNKPKSEPAVEVEEPKPEPMVVIEAEEPKKPARVVARRAPLKPRGPKKTKAKTKTTKALPRPARPRKKSEE